MRMSLPLVIRGGMSEQDWEPLSWSPDAWSHNITSDMVSVRYGDRNPGHSHPQWERNTSVKKIKISDYLNQDWRRTNIDSDQWTYFDYQYMHQVMSSDTLAKFPWDKFGLVGRDGSDSTLWMGTHGAHTPCHQDSYGCNLVCQVAGSKTWTLFPPDDSQHLSPTRVPYEESSVYSRINFISLEYNSQSTLDCLKQATCYQVTLEPGDVLYVPRHWWHHVVTTSDWSISVNTWVPCR